jgi:hypothetical protein
MHIDDQAQPRPRNPVGQLTSLRSCPIDQARSWRAVAVADEGTKAFEQGGISVRLTRR